MTSVGELPRRQGQSRRRAATYNSFSGERHRHANSMGRDIYGHNRDRILIARPLRSGGSRILLAHRKLFGPAQASATPRMAQISGTPIAFKGDDEELPW